MQGVGPGERLLLRLTLAPAPDGWARRYRPLLHAARRADEHGAPRRRPTAARRATPPATSASCSCSPRWRSGCGPGRSIAAIRAGQRPPGPLGIVPWERLVGLHPAVLGAAAGLLLALLLAPAAAARAPLAAPARAAHARPADDQARRARLPGAPARPRLGAGPRPRRRRPPARDGRPAALRPRRRQRARRPPRPDRRSPGRARAAPARSGAPASCRPTSWPGLWGPVGGLADAGDLVRAGATRRRPPRHAPDGRPWLATGCPLGVSEQGGVALPIAFPDELLGRVTLVLGKTGAGKSTALHHLLAHAMADPARGVLVVDPHGDLARALLGLVPRHRRADVIALDLADTERPVGLNPLDVTAGRPPDRIVADTIVGLRRLWPNSWGDRMEQMLRQALITLVERNAHLPPDEQFTLLHVEPLLQNRHFRKAVLTPARPAGRQPRLVDRLLRPAVGAAARGDDQPGPDQAGHLRHPDRRQAHHRPAAHDARPRRGRDGRQDRRSSTWRAASSAATWPPCSARCSSAPSTSPSSGRRRCRPTGAGAVLVAIDELQALPAVDYARLVGELRKYGGGFLLATQTLTGLDRLDPTLRPLLLGNCEALLAFRVAAEEAALLDARVRRAGDGDRPDQPGARLRLPQGERARPAGPGDLAARPPADGARPGAGGGAAGARAGGLGRAGRGGGGAWSRPGRARVPGADQPQS